MSNPNETSVGRRAAMALGPLFSLAPRAAQLHLAVLSLILLLVPSHPAHFRSCSNVGQGNMRSLSPRRSHAHKPRLSGALLLLVLFLTTTSAGNMGIGARGAENKGGTRWSAACEDGTTFAGGAEEMAMTMASTDSMCRVKPRPSSTSSTVRGDAPRARSSPTRARPRAPFVPQAISVCSARARRSHAPVAHTQTKACWQTSGT
jgi:hypothetical protein